MGRFLTSCFVLGLTFVSHRVSAQGVPPAPPPPAPAAPAPAATPAPAAQPPAAQPPAAPPPEAAPAAAPGTYPAPAAAAPPPQAPYAYPAPPAPVPAYPVEDSRPPAATRYPSDSAVRTSPWFDLTVGSFVWDNRIDQFMNIGVQVGAYIAKRVRVAGRAYLPTEDAPDRYDGFSDDPFGVLDGDGFVYVASDPARFLYGADIGIIAANTATFVLSPGLMFMRSDVSDYGTMIGLSLPFEWVTSTGLRVGFEFDVGRAFGGSIRRECQ